MRIALHVAEFLTSQLYKYSIYGVATVSRIDQIIVLFCSIRLFYGALLQK